MALTKTLIQIDEHLAEIGQMGKLPQAILKRINYKFRLDWNYYSNRMEGGTLTKQETRSVMVGNITMQGKPLIDVMEMQGHDEVVRDIFKMGKGEIRISEKRLKQVHKAIIKETQESTNKPIGQWKVKPNEIINYKGEKINFSAPQDVADEVHELLNQTNAQLDVFFHPKKEALHPLVIAADFHLGFVSIHPFYDGNGRCARIFTNLILIACGYPPIIIDDTSKMAYYQLLADIQAYGGKKDLFYEFMANRLLKSVALVKDAFDGKDIEDDDDLEKRLQLLNRQFTEDKDTTIKIQRQEVDTHQFYLTNVEPLLKELQQKLSKIKGFFLETEILLKWDEHNSEHLSFDQAIKNIVETFQNAEKSTPCLSMTFYHKHFKNAGLQSFNVEWSFQFYLEQTKYVLEAYKSRERFKLEKLYHHEVTEAEVKNLAENYLRSCLDEIEEELEKRNPKK